MLVGSSSSHEIRQYYKAQSEKSIKYAVDKIKASSIAPYVRHLYLYGSCARDQQNESSDVDLFLQLADDFPKDQLRDQVFLLKSQVMPLEPGMPEVDLAVVVGDEWRHDNSLFYENLRKDGIEIWMKKTPI